MKQPVDQTKKSRLLKILILLAFLIIPNQSIAESSKAVKIGFIDLNKVAEESATGKAMMEEFKKEGLKRQTEIDEWKKKVDSMEQELIKQGMLLSDTAREHKEKSLRKEKRDLERFFKDSSEEFDRKKVSSEQDLLKKIVQTTQNIGKENGYTMVFSKQFLLYAAEGIDLTQKVIKKIDGIKSE